MGSWSSASSGGMPAIILGGLSPCRGPSDFHKPWWGCWGWLLDFACCGSASWDRVAHELVWAVAVICGTGCLLPRATHRDPLEQAQWVWLWLHSH